MLSKMVLIREKATDDAVYWEEIHGPVIRKAMMASYGKSADPSPILKASIHKLKYRRDVLVAADTTHTREKTDDHAPRVARGLTITRIHEILSDSRSILYGVYGPTGVEMLGIPDAIPKDPVQVEQIAKGVLEVGTKEGFELPTPKHGAKHVDLEGIMHELARETRKLTRVLQVVNKGRKKLELSQAAKDKAFAEFGQTFSEAMGTMAAMARAAGLPELVEKLPSLTRTPYGSATAAAEEVAETLPEATEDVDPN